MEYTSFETLSSVIEVSWPLSVLPASFELPWSHVGLNSHSLPSSYCRSGANGHSVMGQSKCPL